MICDAATLKAIYKDDEIVAAVMESIEQYKTKEKIESGELSLPSLEDAKNYTEQRKLAPKPQP